MKATTTLQVQPGMVLNIAMQITVEEADDLLKAMRDTNAWPSTEFKDILYKSLQAARSQHVAEHAIKP